MNIISKVFSLKGAFCMVFASLVFSFASCDKSDTIEQSAPRAMELLYIESKGIPETSADSVFSFGHKFCDHLNKNKNDQYDEYFQPTVDNMVNAAAGFGYKLTINTGVPSRLMMNGSVIQPSISKSNSNEKESYRRRAAEALG